VLIAVIVHSRLSAYKHLMIMLGHVYGPLKHLNMFSPGSHLHMNKPLKLTDGHTHRERERERYTDILCPFLGLSWTKDKRKSSNYLYLQTDSLSSVVCMKNILLVEK